MFLGQNAQAISVDSCAWVDSQSLFVSLCNVCIKCRGSLWSWNALW